MIPATSNSVASKLRILNARYEADATKNYIYFRSPIGKALIGKNKKDIITVITPSGEKNFEIIEVKYI